MRGRPPVLTCTRFFTYAYHQGAVDLEIENGDGPPTINPYVNAGAMASASQLATAEAVANGSLALMNYISGRISAAQREAMALDPSEGARPIETVSTDASGHLPSVPPCAPKAGEVRPCPTWLWSKPMGPDEPLVSR